MTLLARGECIDRWYMKIEWNRKVGVVDFQESYFLKHSKIFDLFLKIQHSYSGFFNFICEHFWMLEKSAPLIFEHVFFSGNFDIFTFLHTFEMTVIFNCFYFNNGVYEPFRQWLGGQFTGGPKFIFCGTKMKISWKLWIRFSIWIETL